MKALNDSISGLKAGIDHLLHDRTELLAFLTTFLPAVLAEPPVDAPEGTPIIIRLTTSTGDVAYDVEPHHRGHFGHLPWMPHGTYDLPRLTPAARSVLMHEAIRLRAEVADDDTARLEDVAARVACLLASRDNVETTQVTDPASDTIVATTSTGTYEITVRQQ